MAALPDPFQRPTIPVEEAGRILGISRSLAYQGTASGEIPSIQIGGRRVVPTAALLKMLGYQLPEVPHAS